MTARLPVDVSRTVLAQSLIARSGSVAESIGTVFVLFIISGAVLPLLRAGGGPVEAGAPTPVEHLAAYLAYAYILFQVARRPQRVMRAAARNPFLPGIAVIAFVSVTWSDDPSASMKQAALLGMWTLFSLYLIARYDTQELLTHLGIAFAILAVLSLGFGLFAPAYGVSRGTLEGAWRGVFIHKNLLGQLMLMACAVFVLLGFSRRWSRLLVWLLVALAIALIFLSRSRMSMIVLVATPVLMQAVLALRRGGRASAIAVCVLLACLTATAVVVSERDTVLRAIGKDPTMTGRTQLWAAVGESIAQRPLLGHGYGAFWEQGVGMSEKVREAVGWNVPHSHNALLDLWLDLGVFGVATFVAGYIVALRRAWIALAANRAFEGIWAMTVLLMLLPLDMVASPIYENRLSWALLLVVGACDVVQRSPVGLTMPPGRARHFARR